MCGIVGCFAFDAEAVDEQVVRAMLARVQRRGPDGQGIHRDRHCMLGHSRLAVIDLSPAGQQPMSDASGRFHIVFNGTIYNHPELRRELLRRGYAFRSTSDTEVIVNGFACWGESVVERLHGVFALAIWDSLEQRLFLARDRLGIKPLYYARSVRAVYFASSLQALLLAPGCDTSIDPLALHHTLTLHGVVPAPATLLAGIRKCPPAHTLGISGPGPITERRYWTLDARRPTMARSDAEWREALREAVTAAVVRRVEVADVPVGLLLSGGLDSSLLLALMAEAGTGPINTFSIGFDDDARERGDEFEYSDLMANRYATKHQRIHIGNEEILFHLPDAMGQMAEPMFGQDAIAFYLLARQVGQSMKVVQSGQGADELFAGYAWYPRMLATPGSRLQRFASHYFDRDHDEYLQAVGPDYRVDDVSSRLVAEQLASEHAESFIDAVLRFDLTALVVDDPVRRVDNMSMAWGVEARVPFLDHQLVELAAQCPPELKLLNQGKGILKSIARGVVPDNIIDRPKGYFPVPALKYPQAAALELFSDVVTSRQCRERGIFSSSYIDQLLANPTMHLTRLNINKLWQCTALELWLQKNLS